jgi:hypothetical protein
MKDRPIFMVTADNAHRIQCFGSLVIQKAFIPNVVGAIDGTLIKVHRFSEHES